MESEEQQLVLFVKEHEKDIYELQRSFVNLFNDCGQKYNSERLQLALVGVIFKTMLKSTNTPLKEQKNLLKALKEKIK